MLGTAKMLTELKDQWHGTLIILGQPAEERRWRARNDARWSLSKISQA